MKNNHTALISIILICTGLFFYPVASAQSNTFDLKIERLEAKQSTDQTGKPNIHVMATFINTSDTAAENCELSLKINSQNTASETFTKVENGYKYLFFGTYPAISNTGKNTLELMVCPTIANEKNKSNNTKKVTLTVSEKTLVPGTNHDLVINKYTALSIRDKTNTDKYWFSVEYGNNGSNTTPTGFTIDHATNNISTQSVNTPILPPKSKAITSTYVETPVLKEGKNAVRLKIDSLETVLETNENNKYFYLVSVNDGQIMEVKKLSSDPTLLINALMVVNQEILDQAKQQQIPGDGPYLTIPMLNAGNDILGTEQAPVELKITLKLQNKTYEQIYPIAEWKKGESKTFDFISKMFKKKELKKTFNLNVYLSGKKIYSKSMQPTCFY